MNIYKHTANLKQKKITEEEITRTCGIGDSYQFLELIGELSFTKNEALHNNLMKQSSIKCYLQCN